MKEFVIWCVPDSEFDNTEKDYMPIPATLGIIQAENLDEAENFVYTEVKAGKYPHDTCVDSAKDFQRILSNILNHNKLLALT